MNELIQRSWKQRLIAAILVVLGSIGIFFPAWLPDHQTLPTEESAVEGMQLVLLLAGAAFWFGSARSSGEVAPFYRIMGVFGLAAAIGEGDSLIESTTRCQVEYLFIPLATYVVIKFLKNREHFGKFFSEFSAHPAAGFFASAFLMIYVLARFLGTSVLWQKTLGENYHPDIPQTVEGYLELLACYLLLVGTIGICLAPRSHDPTETD